MCNAFFQFNSISCFKQHFERQPKKRLAQICPYQPCLWDTVFCFLAENDKVKLAWGGVHEYVFVYLKSMCKSEPKGEELHRNTQQEED